MELLEIEERDRVLFCGRNWCGELVMRESVKGKVENK